MRLWISKIETERRAVCLRRLVFYRHITLPHKLSVVLLLSLFLADLDHVHLAAVFLLEVRQEVADERPAGWSVEFGDRACLYGVAGATPVAIVRRRTPEGVVVVGVCRGVCPSVICSSRRVPQQAVRPVTDV